MLAFDGEFTSLLGNRTPDPCQHVRTEPVKLIPLLILILVFLLQETRKRKGLKEGLPDLTQYLDKL